MKFMRHRDPGTTASIYTDEMQLLAYEAVKGLPEPGDAQI